MKTRKEMIIAAKKSVCEFEQRKARLFIKEKNANLVRQIRIAHRAFENWKNSL